MMDLLTALGLVLVIEGILFAAFPMITKRSMRVVSHTPADQLRYAGIIGAIIGVAIVYAVKSL
ncbi:DUF2065 domain-containing protein [Microvirga sp. W0021]|uniref:DUF2065 domain-containing protein n=1 Tax=Hohaiivirga grylli TaxID=3133970 RepID=A0ABV0BK31_9HYPH